jgi:imidazolonepropionase-like amidohydrolase
MVDELRAFRAGGGQVLFGTDIGYTDHYHTELEYTLMARAGMSFSEILASLTTNPAQRFGHKGRTGRIAEGMDADLVVLEGDPAQDVRALSRVRMVIRSGQVIYSRN